MKTLILFMIAIFVCVTSLGFAQESEDSVKINDNLEKVFDEIPDGYNFVNLDYPNPSSYPEWNINIPDTPYVSIVITNNVDDTRVNYFASILYPGRYRLRAPNLDSLGNPLKAGQYTITLEARSPGIWALSSRAVKFPTYFRAIRKYILMK